MALVDYDYYSQKYSNLTAEEFYLIEPSAEDYLKNSCRKYVFDAVILDNTDFRYNRIKDAICSICNAMNELQSDSSLRGVSSISNNGYSESYVAGFSKDKSLKNVLISSLTGTGLMGVI